MGQYTDRGFTDLSSYVVLLLKSPPCDLVMTEIQPQLPKGENGPIKRDRKKASRQCQKSILCIPNEKIRKPLTAKDVIGALCLRWISLLVTSGSPSSNELHFLQTSCCLERRRHRALLGPIW